MMQEIKYTLNGGKKGELVQGQTYDGNYFLISLPSPFFSSIQVNYTSSNKLLIQINLPDHNTVKLKQFINLLFNKYNLGGGYLILIINYMIQLELDVQHHLL